ncbi:Uncharacterised protein [Proteus vulgaris]|nr:Uncharacterised protein [Proteus vulgaris]
MSEEQQQKTANEKTQLTQPLKKGAGKRARWRKKSHRYWDKNQ